ncbi:amidase [Aquibacillus rhizosphaerae]|uniref:Amidase n=1 Tax=Aquibacillus rhizosphaerae TaxID=3051431 RepID=A0ABT7L569_9BACI|nr:amidase [Aquibacillus sp. LR5S19]MDL4841013.1 amidase [Aquibacillus sp. LR5S19]
MNDTYRSYVNQDIKLKPSNVGILKDLTFSVKDVFAIKNYLNTAGNPDWYRSHQPSENNAVSIDLLLNSGATLVGTTHTDELMYSLNGENFHYGTPVNPKAPACIPGGSSSGSAVAVAAGDVDFALGTDTGGSVRIPSTYCGVYGFRPTHGAVDINGVIPLAKSFDTVGWMAQDPNTLLRVGKVLLNNEYDKQPFSKVIIGNDGWEQADSQVKQVLSKGLSFFETINPSFEKQQIADEGLETWANTFRILQGMEIWNEHGEWIEKEKPTFGPGIGERFVMASKIHEKNQQEKFEHRKSIQQKMELMLGDEGLLIIPTAPGPAPLKNLPNDQLEDRREKTMRLTCIAGLSGLPQITIPVASVEGKPVGLSIIANRFQDINLLKLATKLNLGTV